MNRRCVVCNKNLLGIDNVSYLKYNYIHTVCNVYICSECIDFKKIACNYYGFNFICCDKCIEYTCNNMYSVRKNVKKIDNHLYLYETYGSFCYTKNTISLINLFENEQKVYEQIKRRIKKRINKFLIKDLINIVCDYIYYKNDHFFYLILKLRKKIK